MINKKSKQKKKQVKKKVKPIEQPQPVVITPLLTKGEENSLPASPVLNDELSNSIQPSITELERLLIFLNKRFNLKLPDDIVVNIQQTSKNTLGFFRPKAHKEHFENINKPLHTIVVSSQHLKETPYETFVHETGHFYNEVNKIKDVSGFQYHNKHFKEIAEKLLLKVERGKRGFAYTSGTPEFQKMINDFKPDKNAFRLFQKEKPKQEKSPNRNLLFMCGCGTKVRTARNIEHPFQATCKYCEQEFVLQDN